MNTPKPYITLVALLLVAILAGCSTTGKAPDVSNNIRKSLDQAGLKDVSVSQDQDKGVVTLNGHVATENEKAQAETIAKSMAGNQVVANQVAVLPPGNESAAKTIDSDLDKGIEHNLDAALVENKLNDNVKYDVKNGVVTLKGEVDSQSKRSKAERIAASVPNVQQVVNELQVKNQKATSTE
jgi:hyperosmotically inducible protein